MTMTIPELERSLRALRLSGMTATLESRALQVAQQQMDLHKNRVPIAHAISFD